MLSIPWKFLKLNHERQAAFMALHYRTDEGRDKYFFDFFKRQETQIKGSKVLPIEKQVKIARIYEAYGIERGDGGYQFCPERKSFNHSCVPNADYCWDPDLQRMTVHAVKDVKLGEEITLTYIG